MSCGGAGTGASGGDVEGGPEGGTGGGVCAWLAPAKQSAKTDAANRKDERDSITLVLVAGMVPLIVVSS